MLNFPTMGLNRAALHNKPDALTKEGVAKMSNAWGSEEWRNLFYEQRVTLFGDTVEVKKGPTRAERLVVRQASNAG